MSTKIISIFILLFAGILPAHAQLEKIDADRPDQTNGPVITPKKWLQFELGFNGQKNNSTENEFLIPTLLTRYGISKRIEVQLITSVKRFLYSTPSGNSIYTSGLVPVQIGAKYALVEEKKWIPKTTFLLHLSIPFLASKKLQADKLAPSFVMSMQHSLTKNLSIGYNLGAQWDGFSDKPTWIYTFSPGFNFGEKWDGYVEVYGFITKDEVAQHNIDGGIAYYPNNNTKLDISSGFGISQDSPVWYIAIGASVRFKTSK